MEINFRRVQSGACVAKLKIIEYFPERKVVVFFFFLEKFRTRVENASWKIFHSTELIISRTEKQSSGDRNTLEDVASVEDTFRGEGSVSACEAC